MPYLNKVEVIVALRNEKGSYNCSIRHAHYRRIVALRNKEIVASDGLSPLFCVQH